MNRFELALYRAAVKGLQDVGDAMFKHSQQIVNVDRGTLKKSGFIEYLPDGVRWGYRAPYARAVNDGVPEPGRDERVSRHPVRAHRRRLAHPHGARKYARVRAHWRGPFVRHLRPRQGSRYMEKSIEAVRPRIASIVGRRMRMAS